MTKVTYAANVVSRRNAVIVAVVSTALAVAAFLLLRGGDEDKIRATIARAASIVSTSEDDTNPLMRLARIKSALKESLTKDASVNVQEVRGVPASLSGIDGIAAAATQGLGMFERAQLDVSSLEIKIADAKQSAQVNAKGTFDGTERGARARREQRDLTFYVVKTDAGWRIQSITVWAPRE